jgi:hypothetical protein
MNKVMRRGLFFMEFFCQLGAEENRGIGAGENWRESFFNR